MHRYSIISFILLGIFCPFIMSGQNCRVDTLLNYLYDKGESNHVMIFAHRGNWRNSAENSIQAFQECIDEGLDGIEIDLQMTKDSVLVIMHDETVDRTTTGKGLVSELTLAELKELQLLSPIRVATRQKVPTFEEILKLAKGKVLIQVDKWKPFYAKMIELAKEYDCERQIIIRTTDKSEIFNKKYGNTFANVVVMPVLVCKNDSIDLDKLEDFINNFSTPAISFSFTKEEFLILDRIPQLKDSGYRIWLNSLWGTFNASHDDELALTDPDNSYGWLINKGANIIFSDNPILLKNYLEKIGKRKTSIKN